MIFLHGFPTVLQSFTIVFLWFAKDQRPTVTDGCLTETDGKTQRLTVTDGRLTETDGSLTDLHGREGQWSGRRWAVVRGPERRWIPGLCRGRCAGVPVCWCADVPVCKCAGVPVCR